MGIHWPDIADLGGLSGGFGHNKSGKSQVRQNLARNLSLEKLPEAVPRPVTSTGPVFAVSLFFPSFQFRKICDTIMC